MHRGGIKEMITEIRAESTKILLDIGGDDRGLDGSEVVDPAGIRQNGVRTGCLNGPWLCRC